MSDEEIERLLLCQRLRPPSGALDRRIFRAASPDRGWGWAAAACLALAASLAALLSAGRPARIVPVEIRIVSSECAAVFDFTSQEPPFPLQVLSSGKE